MSIASRELALRVFGSDKPDVRENYKQNRSFGSDIFINIGNIPFPGRKGIHPIDLQ